MKRGIFNLIVILFISAIVLFGVTPAALADSNDKINLKVDAGFDGQYKIGTEVPISIEIKNNLKDINGEIQIEVQTSSNGVSNDVILYSQKLNLANNAAKQLKMNVPIMKYITKIKINIVEGNKTVFSKEVPFPGGGNSDNLYIGVLSDDYGSLSYINKAPNIQNASISCKNVKVDIKSFPSDADVLKNFDVLVINNIDTSKFTKEQYTSLKKWVYNGGTLIIGTGPSYKKTLSIFQDDFLKGKIGELNQISTISLEKMVGDYNSNPMKLDILDVKVDGSETSIQDNGKILVQKISRNKGTVAVASFDLGIDPIHSWFLKDNFAQQMISLSMSENYSMTLLAKSKGGEADNYGITNALNYIPELPMPKGYYFIIIFSVYILLVGLVNYIVLKKLGKRELMWITVPVMSIIFSAIMFFSGVTTRISKPVANVLSIINVDSNGVSSNTYAGILTPQNKNINVGVSGNNIIKPLIFSGYGEDSSTISNNKHVDFKVMQDGKNNIEFYKSGIFTTRNIKLEDSNVTSGKLECKLNYAKGTYTGTVTNNLGYDLNDCYVLTPSDYFKIGNIKKDETKQINVNQQSSYQGQIYDFLQRVYPISSNTYNGSKNTVNTKLTSEQIKMNQQKFNIISAFFQSNVGEEVNQTSFLGWSNQTHANDIIVDGKKVKKYEKSMVISSVNMSFADHNIVEYPYGYIKPIINNGLSSGNYNISMGKIFGSGYVDMSFKIDDNINVSSISIN
ncbi:MAG: hypothetical protein Q8900_07835, partial [Bacillota bacterium]|nr:hypothetical protein [Bacillota bacterium]